MKKRLLPAFLLVIWATSALWSQQRRMPDDQKAKKVWEYLTLSKRLDGFEQSFTLASKLLKKPDPGLVEFMKDRIPDLKEQMALVFYDNLSKKELTRMITATRAGEPNTVAPCARAAAVSQLCGKPWP